MGLGRGRVRIRGRLRSALWIGLPSVGTSASTTKMARLYMTDIKRKDVSHAPSRSRSLCQVTAQMVVNRVTAITLKLTGQNNPKFTT